MKTRFLKLMAIGLAAGICLSAATGCSKKSNSGTSTTQSMSNDNGGTCAPKREGAPACPKAKPKPAAPTCPKAPSKNGCSSQKEKSASSRKLGAAGRVVHGNQ